MFQSEEKEDSLVDLDVSVTFKYQQHNDQEGKIEAEKKEEPKVVQKQEHSQQSMTKASKKEESKSKIDQSNESRESGKGNSVFITGLKNVFRHQANTSASQNPVPNADFHPQISDPMKIEESESSKHSNRSE